MRSLNLTAIALSTVLCSWSVTSLAEGQPKAEELVGKAYLGVHALKINTDDDRIIDNNFPLSLKMV